MAKTPLKVYALDYDVYKESNKKRRIGYQPITHRYKKAVIQFEQIKKDGIFYKAFKTPEELTILTIHNYRDKPLLEANMDYLGIDYITLKVKENWQNTLKLKYILDLINSKTYKNILFIDARDSIISDNPNKIIPIFKSFDCSLLFNSTMSPRGGYKGGVGHQISYENLWKWAVKIAGGRRYLNSGVFIGRAEFIKEVFTTALDYIKYFPDCDQTILRGIHPMYHPRIKVDYKNELVYRN